MSSATRRRLVVMGAGGHAKVVVDTLRAVDAYEIVGCVGPNAPTTLSGVSLIGGDECLPKLLADGVSCVVVAVGDSRLRLRLGHAAQKLGFELPAILSPSALISSTATIGAGTVVMPRVVVNVDARVGALCILNTGSIVEHDCVLGKGVHLAPGATLCGNVCVGDVSLIGAGASVVPWTTIAAETQIGAGAVVPFDIADAGTYVGVPARPLQRSVAWSKAR